MLKRMFGKYEVLVGAASNRDGLMVCMRLRDGINYSEKLIPIEQFLEETGLGKFICIKPPVVT